MVTYYVVQAFKEGKNQMLVADDPLEARSERHALSMADRLAGLRAGVIAFSRSGDPTTGDYEDAVILAQIGRIPEELFEQVA